MALRSKDLMLDSVENPCVAIAALLGQTAPPKNDCGNCTFCTCITNSPTTCGGATDFYDQCDECVDLSVNLARLQVALLEEITSQAKVRRASGKKAKKAKKAKKKKKK